MRRQIAVLDRWFEAAVKTLLLALTVLCRSEK
jgi:hypothetical protein